MHALKSLLHIIYIYEYEVFFKFRIEGHMELRKFVGSFNCVGVYLTLSTTVLIFLVIFLYVINPE